MERSLEKTLYDAASEGDTKCLEEIVEQEKSIVDRVSYTCTNKTPLHVATMKNHLHFVQEILNHNPHLAEELDSRQSSPLHIASAEGYLEIAKILLLAAPDMCMSRDSRGYNPLHIAAIKGHVEILKILISEAPHAAREKVDRDQTVLHLCVKHGQFEALKILVPNLNDWIDLKDTILHMAVEDKLTEIIRYLVQHTKINLSAENNHGQTAMDILEQSESESRNSEIKKILKFRHCDSKSQTQRVIWLTKKGDSIMVIAVLIATMAFQAGVNPAGGMWEADLNKNLDKAGEAVMATKHPKLYKLFVGFNAIAFFSSVTTILLLISGLPFRRRRLMWVLVIIMWLTVTSISMAYAISITVMTPEKLHGSLPEVIKVGVGVWSAVMGVLLVGSKVKKVRKWFKKKGVSEWWARRCGNVEQVSPSNV